MNTDSAADIVEAIRSGEADRLADIVEGLDGQQTARAICSLSDEDQTAVLTSLEPQAAANVVEDLPDFAAAEVVGHLPAPAAAAILHEMPSDDQADIVGELDEAVASAIMANMETGESRQLSELIAYPSDSAGGLMATELVAFRDDDNVANVRERLRSDAKRLRTLDVQYAYVIDSRKRLVGVLRLRDLLLAQDLIPVAEIMIRNPIALAADATLEQLEKLFDEHRFLGVPVTDAQSRLVGVVSRDAVDEATHDQAASDFRRTMGVVEEEIRTMPVLRRSRLRLAWLSINILLNVVAASVIAGYQDTLAQVIALAVFLPIISDISGCSGSQAVAVSMRELSLGLIRSTDLTRVWSKEALVGLLNGAALGSLLGTVAAVFSGNVWLGLVVGSALACNTLLAVLVGGGLPLLLKRRGVDPALASGPILTTLTDMIGFFLVLSLATAALPRLVT